MRPVNTLMLLLTLLFINSLNLVAEASIAQPTKCYFVSNDAAKGLLSALPKPVVGVATCDLENKDLSSFVILKFNSLDDQTLENAAIQMANINHPANDTAQVTWQSKQPLASRQLMITTRVAKTDHSNEQVMLHYAFAVKAADGTFLVFVHSAPEKETHALRQELEEMNRQLRTPYFLNLVQG